jgi:polyhydroxyalkanoate synthase
VQTTRSTLEEEATMATRKGKHEDSDPTPDRMAEVLGGGEDPLGMSFKSMMGAASAMNAESIARESTRLYNEWLKIMWGTSEREVPQKDWRFSDPVWRDNPMYKRLAQSYLSFCDAVDKVVEDTPDWKKRERAKFLTGILTSAMSPTNTLMGNPAALKKAWESGGQSLVRGTQNMVGDMLTGKGLPSQVKQSDFKVGGNLAMTPGSVVFRNEMVEVLQYKPTTAKVHETPTLMIVPPIGKYYFMDLAPGRSFTEHAVSKGIQYFTTSWKQPRKENASWGLDDYVKTLLQVVDAVCEITGSKKVNILGLCAGGIIATLLLSYMASVGDNRVNAASFGVMLLDFNAEAPLGAFHNKQVLGIARKRSASKGILPASSLATVFAWMRPNDLVWNYWVNNYLEGKDPPSFDILAWSVDGTNLPGVLHSQFLDIFQNNPLPQAGAMKILGKPVDLSKIKMDTLVTGALTDHLTPWKACYRTTQLLGGKSTFVLSNAGHIASLVNPPGNAKASYFIGPEPVADPEQWLSKAEKRTGTWWEVWTDWMSKRSGPEKAAPKELGDAKHPVVAKAPGTYVLEQS